MNKKLFCTLFLFNLIFITFAQSRPMVYDIQTVVLSGRKINIYWKLPENQSEIKKLSVFRSNSPISSFEQIQAMKPLVELSPDTTNYIDTVNDYNEYFYAVIAYTNKYYELIMLSVNSTAKGSKLRVVEEKEIVNQQLEEKIYSQGQLRETPLPLLNLIDEPRNDDRISEGVLKAAEPIIKTSKKKIQKEITPYFFEIDLISPDGGDDFLLFNILKESFIQEDYNTSVKDLNKLIGTNVSDTVIKRAYFYLGQAKFFLGDYEEAVRAFVKVASDFPDLTKLWINRSLDRISLPQ